MKHRYHTWRRVPAIQASRKNTFFCNHPSCFKKAKLETINKKFAECPLCGNTFIVDISIITDEMNAINCPKCLGVESTEESKAYEAIKAETTQFLLSNFEDLERALREKQAELEKRETNLVKRELKVEKQELNLRRLASDHRASFSKHRLALKETTLELQRREEAMKEKEEADALDNEVVVEAVTALFKKFEEGLPNERDGSIESE